MPAVNRAMKYGIKKAPPPLVYATYGNLQMLPSPTAEPTAAIMKDVLLFHRSRVCVMFCSFMLDRASRQVAQPVLGQP